jgi:argininosuccinate lyase
VGAEIESGNFQPEKTVNHSHEGSVGNLCIDKISESKTAVLKNFNFSKVEKALNGLLE